MRKWKDMAKQTVQLLLHGVCAGDRDGVQKLVGMFPDVTLFDEGTLFLGEKTLLMAHSPAVFETAQGIRVTSGLFHLIFREGSMERRLGRIDAEFSVRDGALHAVSLRCRDLLSFDAIPASYEKEPTWTMHSPCCTESVELANLAASTAFHMDAREMSESVRVIWNGQEIRGKAEADAFLRGSETAALLLTTPLQQETSCRFRAVRFARLGDGVQEQHGVLSCVFAPENGAWKIAELRWNQTTAVRTSVYEPSRNPPVFPVCLPGEVRSASPEDTEALGNLMLRWVHALQTGSLRQFYDTHMVHDAPRVALHGKEAVGCEAVVQDMQRMDSGYLEMPMRGPICHTCTTPFFAVDGDTAEGFWYDNNYTNWAQVMGVREVQEEVTYMTSLCVYHHTFRRENGRWKLAQFRWRSLFSMTPLCHRPAQSAGWVGSRTDEDWPPLPDQK